MALIEGIVGVNMESKFEDSDDRRIKFEDNSTWYGADPSLSDKLGRGWKVKARVEGSGNDARITKVKVLEKSAPKGKGGGYRKGGGGGGKSNLTKEEWAAKDRTIQYQHAQKVGVSLIEVQIAAGVFKVPAKNKEEAFMTQYDRMVASVFADIAGQDAVKRVLGETEEDDEVEDESDDDMDDDLDDDDDDEFDD
jgi:hypothetical protein